MADSGWDDRQIPSGDAVFIDHVGYFVDDLDDAGRRLERLGFGVSPINLQTNQDARGNRHPSGTSNRLALMRRGFVEALAATHDTPLAAQLETARRRYRGLHLIALSHADLAAQRARLIAAGFAMQPVVELRRQIATPIGERTVEWSVLRPEPGVMPEGRIQFAVCRTPELAWPADAIDPANAADGLTDVLLCVADPAEAAARFGRFVDRQPDDIGGLTAIELDRGRLVFAWSLEDLLPGVTPPTLPFMAGYGLRCRDLDRTKRVLANNQIAPLVANDELVCVGPADGLGCAILFHRPSLDAPWHALAGRR